MQCKATLCKASATKTIAKYGLQSRWNTIIILLVKENGNLEQRELS